MADKIVQNNKDIEASQEFIAIKDIYKDIVVLKRGGIRKILMLSAVNFELKSQEEKELIIAHYQAFLNSLDFPIQVVVSSRKADIESYIESLNEKIKAEASPLIKMQAEEYLNFVRNLIEIGNISTKRFYLSVPYYPPLAEAASGLKTKLTNVFGIFGKKQKKEEEIDEKQLFEWQTQLNQRVEYIISGLSRIGIKAVPVEGEALIDLLYDYYNPTT